MADLHFFCSQYELARWASLQLTLPCEFAPTGMLPQVAGVITHRRQGCREVIEERCSFFSLHESSFLITSPGACAFRKVPGLSAFAVTLRPPSDGHGFPPYALAASCLVVNERSVCTTLPSSVISWEEKYRPGRIQSGTESQGDLQSYYELFSDRTPTKKAAMQIFCGRDFINNSTY